MHTALVYERNSADWGEPARLVDSMARRAATTGSDGRRPFDDPLTRERLGPLGHARRGRPAPALPVGVTAASGALPQVEGSMAKLFVTETFVRAAHDLVELAGPWGLLPRHQDGTVLDGLLERGVRHAVVTTIYGGASEIQREIVAHKGWGCLAVGDDTRPTRNSGEHRTSSSTSNIAKRLRSCQTPFTTAQDSAHWGVLRATSDPLMHRRAQ